MKLKDLAGILWSTRGDIQMVVVYDFQSDLDLTTCSAEYAIAEYGECNVVRITADKDKLVLHICV